MQNLDILKELFQSAILAAYPELESVEPTLERPKDETHGDFACTIALRLAKQLSANPREIAGKIVDNFPANDQVEKIEIAGPGFINLYLNDSSVSNIINKIRSEQLDFCKGCGKGVLDDIDKRVNLEYISANPTGPMHVGHGR